MNTKTLNRSTGNALLASIVLATAGGGLALPVTAEPVGAAPQKIVSYADLDLSRAEGAATLYGRLRLAAKQVCGDQGRRLEEITQWKACYQRALDEAVTMVDKPTVTAHHIAKQGAGSEPTEPAVAKAE